MDCECGLPKFKGITDNIIKTEHDQYGKILKIHYKENPNTRIIMNIIRYLNSTECWKNFKFNQYSVKNDQENYVITFCYLVPKLVFSK